MYVCMYVCMYVRMYVCTYVRMYVCTYVCVRTYVPTYVCMYVYVHICYVHLQYAYHETLFVILYAVLPSRTDRAAAWRATEPEDRVPLRSSSSNVEERRELGSLKAWMYLEIQLILNCISLNQETHYSLS